MQGFPTLRCLHARGAMSRGLVVDEDGVSLGPDCMFVRRTSTGYRVVNPVEVETILRYAFRDRDDFSELALRLNRIARALEAGDLAKAQILGLQLPFDELDEEELRRLEIGTHLVEKGYDPSQPRDEDGRWTSGGGGASSSGEAGLRPQAPMDALFALPPGADTNIAAAGRLLESPTAVTVGEAADAAAGGGLAVAGRLAPRILGRLAWPLAIVSELIASNRSNIYDGAVPGVPNVSYHVDEGVLTLLHQEPDGALRQLYFGFPDSDGAYQDDDGNVIGRKVGTKLILNSGFIASLADGTATVAHRPAVDGSEEQLPTPNSSPANATDDSEICHAPLPENINGRSERSLAYQEQITGLPRGLDVPYHGVRFDGCDPPTTFMLEAKGPGLAWPLEFMPDEWLRTNWKAYLDFMDQAGRQSRAAPDRIIEWHFADKSVADFFGAAFRDAGYANIVVRNTEAIVEMYLGWLRAMVLMEKLDERRWS